MCGVFPGLRQHRLQRRFGAAVLLRDLGNRHSQRTVVAAITLLQFDAKHGSSLWKVQPARSGGCPPKRTCDSVVPSERSKDACCVNRKPSPECS
ncbi:hypothetical protein [Lysobacter gummosus]|uniref:hypothetical protein n=1 Tax=Lysobacter gummosus TaxID=262324 RepID=UPI003638F226